MGNVASVPSERSESSGWPELPPSWNDTYATLHMWTQVVGKIALAQAPPLNHCWSSALQLTARGLTTRPLPHGERTFTIEFDFDRPPAGRHDVGWRARARCRWSRRAVAVFYATSWRCSATCSCRSASGRCRSKFPIRSASPRTARHASYDEAQVEAFWRILVAVRAGLLARALPVHRQGESGALLLGQLRPGGDAIFGTARAAARRPGVHARRLLARSDQPRLLARQRTRNGVRTRPG